MKHFFKTIIFLITLYPLVLNANIGFDTSTIDNGGSPFDESSGRYGYGSSYDPILPQDDLLVRRSENLSFSTQNFGFTGPLSLGGTYSKNYGFAMKGQWAQGVGLGSAIALLFEFGRDQARVNGTFGHAFTPANRLKFSAEYLQQQLNFNFDSGAIKQRVGQGAYGLTYQYLVSTGFFHDININAFYSHVVSSDLENKIFIGTDQKYYENFRRIAGGIDKSASLGMGFQPMKSNLLGIQLNYDQVNYDKIYDPTDEDVSGFGATVSLQQLLTSRLKLKLNASTRKPTNVYEAELAWLCPTEAGSRLELTFMFSRLLGGHGLPSDNRFGLNIGYSFGGNPVSLPGTYALALDAADRNIATWTNTPAVYMPQVFAVKDQKTNLISEPSTSIEIPIFGYLNQFLSVDITSYIIFGSSKLLDAHEVLSGQLEAYGLTLRLTDGGTKVVVEGTPTMLESGVNIAFQVKNLAGYTLIIPGTIHLTITSAPVVTSVVPIGGPGTASVLRP